MLAHPLEQSNVREVLRSRSGSLVGNQVFEGEHLELETGQVDRNGTLQGRLRFNAVRAPQDIDAYGRLRMVADGATTKNGEANLEADELRQ